MEDDSADPGVPAARTGFSALFIGRVNGRRFSQSRPPQSQSCFSALFIGRVNGSAAPAAPAATTARFSALFIGRVNGSIVGMLDCNDLKWFQCPLYWAGEWKTLMPKFGPDFSVVFQCPLYWAGEWKSNSLFQPYKPVSVSVPSLLGG